MKRLIEQGKVRYMRLAKPHRDRAARHRIHPLSRAGRASSRLLSVHGRGDAPDAARAGVSRFVPIRRSGAAGSRTVGSRRHPADDRRRDHPRFQDAHFAKNLELVRQIEPIAKEKNARPGQLALRVAPDAGPDIIPIPGTKRTERRERT